MRQILFPLVLAAAAMLPACQSSAPALDPADADTKVVKLQHVDGAELAETLRKFLAEDAAAQGLDLNDLQVAHDAKTNSLLIRGAGPQVDQVLALVNALDKPADS